MSYRNHIAIIKKSELEDLLACKTEKDLKKVYDKYFWDYDIYDNPDGVSYYFNKWGISAKEEYELGKYFDADERFYKTLTEIFPKDSPLYDMDCEFLYGNEKTFPLLIEHYRKKVLSYFKNLLLDKPDPESFFDNLEYKKLSDSEKYKWQLNRLKADVQGKITEWEYKPYNLDFNSDTLVTSWLYEYAVFELVRIYKTFNPETDAILFYGC